MFDIIGLLASAFSAVSKFIGWLSGRAQRKAGADAQTVRDIQTAEPVEAAETQAVMDAPRTKPAALDRLRKGDA